MSQLENQVLTQLICITTDYVHCQYISKYFIFMYNTFTKETSKRHQLITSTFTYVISLLTQILLSDDQIVPSKNQNLALSNK